MGADSVEDLISAVHSDAMRIGPSAAEIIEWVEQAIEKERRRRAGTHSTEDFYTPSDAPMRLHLEWRNGTIDQAGSHIVLPAPAEVHAYAEGSEVGKSTAPVAVGNVGAAIDQILGEPVGAIEDA